MSKIRIKKRYGRLHRLFLFSSNQVKGSTLRPTYSEEFHLRIDPESPGGLGGPGSTNGAAIPLQDTEDVTAILDDVKEKVYKITQFTNIQTNFTSMKENGMNCKIEMLSRLYQAWA